MRGKRFKKFLAGIVSVATALSMAVGVQPVTEAKANTVGEDGCFTIYYDLNDGASLSTADLGLATGGDITVNETDKTIKIAGDTLASGTYNVYTEIAPTRSHYSFTKWTNGVSDDAVTGLAITNGGATSISAVWDAKSYTATFDANGGSEISSDSTSFTIEDLATLGSDITVTPPEHKRLAGWNTAADGTGTALSAINTSDALTTALGGGTSLTLYAQYKAATPNVTYALANGDPYVPSSDAFKKYTYSEGAQDFALPATQTTAETGYAMKWKIGSTVVASEGTYEIPAGSVADLEFTEFAEPISYTISYTDKDNDPVSPTSAKESWNVKDDTTMALPAAKSDAPANKEFAGWSDGKNTYAAGATYTFDKDHPGSITFKETWSNVQYNITFTGLDGMTDGDIQDELVVGGNTKVGDTVVKKYTVEDTITLPSAGSLTNAGKYFTGWTVQGEADLENGGTAVTGWAPGEKSANITLVANWTPVYAITYNLGGGAFATTGNHPTTWKAADGEIGTLAEAEKDHYTFVEWRTNPKDHSTAVAALNSTTVTGDLTLYAVYTADEYTITLTGIDATGSADANNTTLTGLGFTKQGDNSYTKTVTVETPEFEIPNLAPKTHYQFDGWSDGGSVGSLQTITVLGTTSNLNYAAAFSSVETLGIAFSLNGGAFVDASALTLAGFGYEAGNSDSITVYADDDFTSIATIPNPAKENLIFAGWTVNDSSAKIINFKLPDAAHFDNASITLTANWETAPEDGETIVKKEGSGAAAVDVPLDTIKTIVDPTVAEDAVSITKVEVMEDIPGYAHAMSGAKDKLDEILVATGAVKQYVDIDILKYVTTDKITYTEEGLHDLGKVIEIVYIPSDNTVDVDDLTVVIREHGEATKTYKVFTRLSLAPAAGAEVDGTYYVDTDGKIHLFTRYFSTYAFGYAEDVYNVTFDSDGGTAVPSIVTDFLPTPLPITTRSGYTFDGWFIGDTQVNGGEGINEDTIVKAKWTKNSTPPAPGPGGGGGGSTPATPTTSPTTSPTATPTASPTATPTASSTPTVEPTTEPTTDPEVDPTPAPKGEKLINSDGYVIISNGDGTATFAGLKDEGRTALTINTVKYGGITYKITAVGSNALKGNKKLTKITIGKNVKKIGKKAFYGCNHVKTVVVKSTKLTDASRVGKNSFKGIKPKATFKIVKKNYKKTVAAFKKKSGAKKPKYKKA